MKKKMIAMILVLVICAMTLAGCASWNRGWKSFTSDLSGGLDRTITVYDYNGNEIHSWTGKIDISESEDEVFFDLNGKRTVIHGGIVIIQEN